MTARACIHSISLSARCHVTAPAPAVFMGSDSLRRSMLAVEPQPYMTISPLPYDPQKEGRFRDCCAASPHIPAVLHDYCSYHLLSKYFNNELAREDLPLIGVTRPTPRTAAGIFPLLQSGYGHGGLLPGHNGLRRGDLRVRE